MGKNLVAVVINQRAVIIPVAVAIALFYIALATEKIEWEQIVLLSIGVGCVLMALGLLGGVNFEGYGVKLNVSVHEKLDAIERQNLFTTNVANEFRGELSKMQAML